MISYPAPQENPFCQCRDGGFAAFLCPFGHLLECHFPYRCNEAACTHLLKYDYEPEQLKQIEEWVRDLMNRGLRPPYSLDQNGRVVIKEKKEGNHDT